MAENHKSKSYWIYGQHAVQAAVSNPARKIERLVASSNAVKELKMGERKLTPDTDIRQLEKVLPKDAVHQGVAALVQALPEPELEDVLDSTLLLVLDQVTDPHNVGAILRSAAAFGAGGGALAPPPSPAPPRHRPSNHPARPALHPGRHRRVGGGAAVHRPLCGGRDGDRAAPACHAVWGGGVGVGAPPTPGGPPLPRPRLLCVAVVVADAGGQQLLVE